MQWCDLSDEESNENKISLTFKYDMAWQNISYGRRYDSSSGHAFIIGGMSGGVIYVVLYSNTFQKCDAADNRREDSK